MDTWLEDFVAYLRYERNYSENTIKPYHDSLEAFGLFIKSLDSDLDWRHVTSDVIRDWIVCLMDRGITPSGVCPRLSAVKSFYRFLLRRGLVETDPDGCITHWYVKEDLRPVFYKNQVNAGIQEAFHQRFPVMIKGLVVQMGVGIKIHGAPLPCFGLET